MISSAKPDTYKSKWVQAWPWLMVIPPSATRNLLAFNTYYKFYQLQAQIKILFCPTTTAFQIFLLQNFSYLVVGMTIIHGIHTSGFTKPYLLVVLPSTTSKLHKTGFLTTLPSFTDHYPHPNCHATIQSKYYNSSVYRNSSLNNACIDHKKRRIFEQHLSSG